MNLNFLDFGKRLVNLLKNSWLEIPQSLELWAADNADSETPRKFPHHCKLGTRYVQSKGLPSLPFNEEGHSCC